MYTLHVTPPEGSGLLEQTISDLEITEDTVLDIVLKSDVTAVGEETNLCRLPETFALHPSYPNPFNAQTRIRYELPKACKVQLTLYNTLGQKVGTLVDQPQEPGWYEMLWDGMDESGRELGSGMYLYVLEAGEFVAVQKALVLR